MVDVKYKGSVLEDNYPVYWDYFYIIEKPNQYDELIKSDIQGTVKDLKADFKKRGINVTNIYKYKQL